jgi:hypothetical protein
MSNNILIINAKQDAAISQRLERFMRPMKANVKILSEVISGTGKNHWLKSGIEGCDIIVLLVSTDFLCDVWSIYQSDISERGKTIIPLIIKPCEWENERFSALKERNIEDFDNEDIFFKQIFKDIKGRLNEPNDEILEEVSAGNGIENSNFYCSEEKNTFGNLAGIVRGNSMDKEFRNGDRILAEPIMKNSFYQNENVSQLFQKDKYYVLNIRDVGLVLKQVELQENEVILKSLNHDYPDCFIYKEDVLNIWVVIKIIERIL